VRPILLGGRLIFPPKHLGAAVPSPALREHVRQADLTESLLCAYDKVASVAYAKFLDCGARAGSEMKDWLEAEQEVLGSMQVDVSESDEFVTALASLPGYRSAQITLGVEPRWLLIFGCHERDDRGDAPWTARSLDPLRGPPRMDAASLAVMCAHASRENCAPSVADSNLPASNLFCILELPAEVDPERCTAILSNGLLGIRMCKAGNKTESGKISVSP